MLIPVSFPLFPPKASESKRRRQNGDGSQGEELDGATLAERETIYQSIGGEPNSALGNLSLTFPNYNNTIDNQYRRVDPR